MFTTGQTELQSRDFDKEKEENESAPSSIKTLNKFKLMVLTNAVCVDILVWATKDENGNFAIFRLRNDFSNLDVSTQKHDPDTVICIFLPSFNFGRNNTVYTVRSMLKIKKANHLIQSTWKSHSDDIGLIFALISAFVLSMFIFCIANNSEIFFKKAILQNVCLINLRPLPER